ncbi:MAG: hypothetical protein ACKOCK_06840, partial [Chloroflexota bacterium]
LTVNQLVVLVLTLVVVALAIVVVRRRCAVLLREDSDAILAISAAILSVYGLILGLTMGAAWERFQIAEFALRDEANAMFSVSRMGVSYDEKGMALSQSVVDYGEAVVSHELLSKSPDETNKEPASEALYGVYRAMESIGGDPEYIDLNAVDPTWAVIIDLENARGTRLQLAENALPHAFWAVLLFGAVLSIGGLVVILPTHPKLHMIVALGATGLIVLLLLLINNLDRPYQGAFTVDFEEFSDAVDLLKREHEAHWSDTDSASSIIAAGRRF